VTESVLISKAPPDSLFELATDQWTEPFWQAAREHRLAWPCCTDCGREREMAAPFCHHCLSQGIEWKTLSGRGTVYSYTVVRYPLLESMNDCVPYVPAVIALEGAGGHRLISNVVGAPLASIHIGAQVEVAWHDRADGVTVPRFQLAE
jgi:uncharacterized OB-fold protein